MTRRTLADAAGRIEELADAVPRPTHATFVRELEQARDAATDVAERAHVDKAQQADDLANRIGQDTDGLARDLATLAVRATLGVDSANDLADELAGLQRTQRLLSRQTEEIHQAVDQLRIIESDPVSWVDTSLYERYPLIRPEFTF